MTQFIIGDLLTGRRLQTIPDVISGSWSETLNGAGEVSCMVPLRDPDVARLGLRESALPGKAFLAAVDGDVSQAGPIWLHDYDGDTGHLTLIAGGMWSYFDHRVLLPVLAGRLPTDPTTDTNFAGTKSLQGVARALVEQAQTATNGNVPVILPAEIAGTSTRAYKGSDLGFVGDRLRQLTSVLDGPDIQFKPRLTSDRLGVEWVLRIGTPSEPLLFAMSDVVFSIGLPKSSVSKFKVKVDGTELASQGFATGGRTSDEALVAVSTDTTLTDAGFPLMEVVDSTHSTVTETDTLQGYSDQVVEFGKRAVQAWRLAHDVSQRPFVGTFTVGDFAKVRVHDDPYVADGEYRLRITSRSGDAEGRKVKITFQPEVI